MPIRITGALLVLTASAVALVGCEELGVGTDPTYQAYAAPPAPPPITYSHGAMNGVVTAISARTGGELLFYIQEDRQGAPAIPYAIRPNPDRALAGTFGASLLFYSFQAHAPLKIAFELANSAGAVREITSVTTMAAPALKPENPQ